MPLRIAEIFGRSVENVTDEANQIRHAKHCPFRDSRCTKSSETDPLGICTYSDGMTATCVCPVRFVENNRIFFDAARLAFGLHARFAWSSEIRILRKANGKKIGKIDYVLAHLNQDNDPINFAALEVQAVYVSGGETRTAMNYFLENRKLNLQISTRRADYRSSAQKRLMPQLSLKVPVFRRWGKKFFIVVDSLFFGELPVFRQVTPANAEVTWLAYPVSRTNVTEEYRLGDPTVIYSLWDDVVVALREGQAPEPDEIILELRNRIKKKNHPIFTT